MDEIDNNFINTISTNEKLEINFKTVNPTDDDWKDFSEFINNYFESIEKNSNKIDIYFNIEEVSIYNYKFIKYFIKLMKNLKDIYKNNIECTYIKTNSTITKKTVGIYINLYKLNNKIKFI